MPDLIPVRLDDVGCGPPSSRRGCAGARAVALLFMAALLLLGGGGYAKASPPIWRVRTAKGAVVLFGSIHLLSRDLSWRTAELDQALATADALWFEIPFDAASQALASEAALRRSRLPAGEGLLKLLPKKPRQALVELAVREGLPPATLDRLQPWFAETMLSVLYYEGQGAEAASGVEEQLSKSAPPTVARGAFETADQQIGFFADMSRRDQIQSLEETLKELDQDPDAFQRLETAWLAGDVAAIDKEAVSPLRQEAPGAWRRLVADRNRRWTDMIVKLVAEDKQVLIVVGVGHLVGEGGVPALLRARGLKVEGP